MEQNLSADQLWVTGDISGPTKEMTAAAGAGAADAMGPALLETRAEPALTEAGIGTATAEVPVAYVPSKPWWGLKGLAFDPMQVEANRDTRAAEALSFDELPATASTMFEDLGVRLEQHVGDNNLVPAYWLEEGAARSRTVCLIDASGIDYLNRPGSWNGTGFLVAPGILCTNHHVINSRDVALRCTATFDFAAKPGGGVRSVSSFRLRPDLLFWTSPVVQGKAAGGLDVTFVAVEGEPGVAFGHNALLRQSFAVADRQYLNIIQHPSGRMKEAALRENTLTYQDAQILHYRSDTEPGSSGAPVFNDAWELVALHHAAKGKENEGIKFSAIASAIEQDAQRGDPDARKLLRLFRGTDELMGFFGSLGRSMKPLRGDLERVVDAYQGEDQDFDIGFWNVEWFNKRWQDKLDAVARIVVEMNLDLWVFVESSAEATEALAAYLESHYGGQWGVLASQDASSELQITTVLWNKKTAKVTRKAWPEKVHRWFQVDSRNFDDLGLEAVHGRVFDRYPAWYEVGSKLDAGRLRLNLVPVHLKAKDEGSLRRRMASRLIAEAIAEVSREEADLGEWVVGGDFNATLDSGDMDALQAAGLTAISAKDAEAQQITYIKAPFKSFIDHIFVSSNLSPSSNEDFVVVALDRSMERFLDVSDHRPILMRLSTGGEPVEKQGAVAALSEEELQRVRRGLSANPRSARRPSVDEALNKVMDRTVYYDKRADAVLRESYWSGVQPGVRGFTGKVQELLESTHTQQLRYLPAQHVYPWMDVQPDGKIRSIYSGEEGTPESFIQHDLQMDRLRLETMEAMRRADGALESDRLEAILEAQYKYNCEHVVPQSWFGKAEPMRGDLQHLFSCDSRCNSFRSNNPYTIHELERTMEDCGRLEGGLFEPRGGKGAVARATLYFMLRYPGYVGNRYAGDGMRVLRKWHEDFPPDEWELHRNAVIHAMQGNRNPLIDFPEWVESLKFSG